MLFRVLASALALASTTNAFPAFSYGKREENSTLNAAIVAKGRNYIGTSLTIRSDETEQNLIRGPEFGSITPENAMKWDATEPTRGVFNFTSADEIADFATKNNKQMRCHTLVWYGQLPTWVSRITNNATLISVMTKHIQTVVGRYKGKCAHWDVANEALNEDGTYRSNIFLQVIGQAYLPIAFRIAAAADPAAKLYYNDYNLEYGSVKHAGALRLVKYVQSWGVKIDGVGLQGHFVSEKTKTQDVLTPSTATMTKVLQDYADLKLDVAYTELDIRMNTPTTPEKLQVQADDFAKVAQSCVNVDRCVGITLWGVSDKYSWVPQTFSGEGAPLLWDENYAKKPAYASFLDALSGPKTNGTRV